jgi:processive 1,2-diacylglycerol beta-glucosyltransferase
MTKVLFMPLLQIPSGHHQVVTSLSELLDQCGRPVQYKKVDLLSFTYKHLETMISTLYLKWIHCLPSIYHWIYEKSVYRSLEKEKRFILYEFLFLQSMRRIIHLHNPDFIICSHALPSYLASKLKENGECSASIINVYTDFFIHHIWGTKAVDAHFISLSSMREYLMNKGINEHSIYQTGIPIHPYFQTGPIEKKQATKEKYKVLVTGGSLGVGKLEHLLSTIPLEGDTHYYVLCGSNTGLYSLLKEKQHSRITPFPYITSKQKLNDLYNLVDAVLTKPGGVTLSECLYKRLPTFIYDHLPGQEKINVDALLNEQLITFIDMSSNQSFERQMIQKLRSAEFIEKHTKKMQQYHEGLTKTTPIDFIFRLS